MQKSDSLLFAAFLGMAVYDAVTAKHVYTKYKSSQNSS